MHIRLFLLMPILGFHYVVIQHKSASNYFENKEKVLIKIIHALL